MCFADFFCKKIISKRRFAELLILFSICFFIVNYTKNSPAASVSSQLPQEVIVSGEIVGIRIDMDGIMVLGITGLDTDSGRQYPAGGVFREGDCILSADGKKLENKEDLINAVERSEGKSIDFVIKRNDREMKASVVPLKGYDGVYRLGVWVRDSTQGLGTLTFYNKNDRHFGALGHGITDVDTGKLMSAEDGELYRADITAVVKGKKGSPGELIGELSYNDAIGRVYENNKDGVYGNVYEGFAEGKAYRVGDKNSIRTGEAYILSGISGRVEKYSVRIEGINRLSHDSTKCMTVRITDKRLLDMTGGIIQGMSGSPIVQNDRVVGALTHVFLNAPDRGYGIFIENML